MSQILTLKQHAYENILKRLESGQLKPGARLSDNELSQELGVSRSPVREAILQLAGEGLIEQRPRLGAFVRFPDREELVELFEARSALESFAAGWAAERRSKRDLNKLIKLTKEMHDIADRCRESNEPICDSELTSQFLKVDYQAHMIVLEMANNSKVTQMIRVWRILSRAFSLAAIQHEIEVIVHTLQQHEAIVEAIADEDAERAKQAMASHLEYACARVMSAYDFTENDPENDERIISE